MAQASMLFPADFRWGTATSSYQVEGGNQNSDWWQWEQQPGAVLESHRSGAAADWWERAERDLDHAAEMGTNAHRMSLEWSRIEPEPSVFDDGALERYRHILEGMHQRGIEPMVTLHHFSNPLWFVEKGDWGADVCIDYFQRYAAKVADTLGDLIPKWITINEPAVYLMMRYLEQSFPAPRRHGFRAASRAMRYLLQAHAAAYHAIKSVQPAAQVGIAKNLTVLQPYHPRNPLARWWNRQADFWFNEAWLRFMQTGQVRWPVGRGTVKGLAGSFDFIGVNYYSRYYTKFPLTGELTSREWGPDATVTDGQYGEVYPAGLFQTIKRCLKYGKPIYITENGLPDQDDDLRPSFIIAHLREVWRANCFNYPVMGYYHWSLVDNFEWDRGWTQRFGLIALDPQTQERTWRSSAYLYQEICRMGGISSQMAEAYAPTLMDTLFPGAN
jgi:beta-glucosidase